jgi:nucleoside-diphosphate-sugar epimerase
MTRVLITGGGGFIGRHLVERFAAADLDVVCVLHSALVPSLDLTVETTRADLDSAEACRELLRRWRPDVLIHAASRPITATGPLGALNQHSGHWMLDAAARESADTHVILFGSAAEYGIPAGEDRLRESDPCFAVSPYGRAKLAATEDAMERTRRGEVRATVLRPFNVIGPGIGGHLPLGAFLKRYAAADPVRRVVQTGPIDAARDFVAVTDVALAAERAIAAGTIGEVINVCTGEGRSLRELLARTMHLVGAKAEIDSTLEHPVSLPRPIVGDPEKCRALLGFVPSADLDRILIETWSDAMARVAARVDAPGTSG